MKLKLYLVFSHLRHPVKVLIHIFEPKHEINLCVCDPFILQ